MLCVPIPLVFVLQLSQFQSVAEKSGSFDWNFLFTYAMFYYFIFVSCIFSRLLKFFFFNGLNNSLQGRWLLYLFGQFSHQINLVDSYALLYLFANYISYFTGATILFISYFFHRSDFCFHLTAHLYSTQSLNFTIFMLHNNNITQCLCYIIIIHYTTHTSVSGQSLTSWLIKMDKDNREQQI